VKIIIDMARLREAMIENPSLALPDACVISDHGGLKTLRELAVFSFACRRCEDAPCIAICPAEALEKDSAGIVQRNTNLCVACKSCVVICPFGTMMTDFFAYHRNRDLLFRISSEQEMEAFAQACPPGTVSLTENGEDPERNIYFLNEKVLIRDFAYTFKS